MEILKKMLATVIITILIINAKAQTFNETKEAFASSYSYEKKGEYKNAIAEIKKVYSENSYEINLRLGWLNYEAGSFTESISHYKRAIELMPLSIEARMGITFPYSAMGKWEEIKNTYSDILKIAPNHSIANYRLGLIYYNRANYESAGKHLNTVVNQYPFDYDSVLLLAWTNLKLGKTREAKVLFQKALLYNPDDSSAKEGLILLD